MIRALRRWWRGEERGVWIAGRFVECDAGGEHPPAWDLLGVFTSAARARKRCTYRYDFIAGPLEVNVELAETREVFPGIRYPWLETDREAAERSESFEAPWLESGASG